MKYLGYYNGEIGEFENMKIPMSDRVCFFGDGVYDATYSRNYKIFCIDEHIDRLFRSASLLKINTNITKNQLKNLLECLVKKMDTPNNFVYFQLSRGLSKRTHDFDENLSSNLLINIFHKEINDVYKKVNLITKEDTRFFHCNIKTLNLIPSVMASQLAKENNCFETIFHRNNRVTECAHSNISIIKNNTLITAPTDNLILAGITRANLLKTCSKLNIPFVEKAFYLDELFSADEIIITSAGSLCISAYEIDKIKVGGKSPYLLKALQDDMLNQFITKTT